MEVGVVEVAGVEVEAATRFGLVRLVEEEKVFGQVKVGSEGAK